jgi:hypothetical protein
MRRFDGGDDGSRPPEDLGAWSAAGWRRIDAVAWRSWNFTLAEAQRWRKAGVTTALSAAQWQTAGVDPDTVRDWMAAKIGSAEAIRWHEFGYDLEQAREQQKLGRGPDEAYNKRRGARSMPAMPHTRFAAFGGIGQQGVWQALFHAGVPASTLADYMRLQWFDDVAVSWARAGVFASDAKVWIRIGLTPAEARQLQDADATPLDVIEKWWRAGIPFEEVADWLGAGLTPEEAVAQRAAGVTVDQAAALRALRQGGGQ